MTKKLMTTLVGLVLFAANSLLLPGISRATVSVNCGTGELLQAAINGAPSGETIEITGMCDEDDVTVPGDKADLTLEGVADTGAGIDANCSRGGDHNLIIQGTNIMVKDLTITNGRGIVVELAGSAFIEDNEIKDGCNNGIGIQVETSGHATILSNIISGFGRGGILVTSAASAFVGVTGGGPQRPPGGKPNLIQDNGVAADVPTASGIKVRRTARLRAEANCIRNNTQFGVAIDQLASAHVSGNTIDSNLAGGITVSSNSVLTLDQDSAGGIHNAPNVTSVSGGDPNVCTGFPLPVPAGVASVDFNNGGVGLECASNSFIGGITGSVMGASSGSKSKKHKSFKSKKHKSSKSKKHKFHDHSSKNDVKVDESCFNELI